ncbi:hypothetical protein [Streptomyces sp. NPDC046727]|uniref:hypothetical protein n=1 Tax=Streptomyces sp. NPDC046727 TaxID=3155373 RepID=UPI0033DB01EC
MAVDQLPGRVREFASYLDAVLARLDPRGGWSGVFWQRDPEGMRACLDGREVPPWDVVEALLEDLGAAYGSAAAVAERERARALYGAALAAYDARPGAREALLDRLDVMLREQRYAAERHAELIRLLSTPVSPEESDSLRHDLAWADDDHARATARCAELQARLADLDRRRLPAGEDVHGGTGGWGPPGERTARALQDTPPDPYASTAQNRPTEQPTHSAPAPTEQGSGAGQAGRSGPYVGPGSVERDAGAERAGRSGPYTGTAPMQQGAGAEQATRYGPYMGPGSEEQDAGAGRAARSGLYTGTPHADQDTRTARDGKVTTTTSPPPTDRPAHPADAASPDWSTGAGAPAVAPGRVEPAPGAAPVDRSASSGASAGSPVRSGPSGRSARAVADAASVGWSAQAADGPAGRSTRAADAAPPDWSVPPGASAVDPVGSAQAPPAADTTRPGRPVQPGAPAVDPVRPAQSAPAPDAATPDWFAHPSTSTADPVRPAQAPPGWFAQPGNPAVDPGRPGPALHAGPPGAQDSRTSPSPAGVPQGAMPPAAAAQGVVPDDPAAADALPDAPAKPRKRRRGSARFAGVVDGGGVAPAVVPEAAVARERRAPRGARFAGVEETRDPVVSGVEVVDEEGRAVVAEAVSRLARLRAEGRSGEAHVLLVEAAQWPVGRLPLLADALQRAGLGADWATLLWEAAALPAERLVAAADALAAAGRDGDGRQMLRQGVARPAELIGAAVLRLDGEGRGREVRALLDAYVRVRTPEEAARCVTADPRRLVPLVLAAALGVSDERHWDLVHALRVAGYHP